MDRLRKRVSYLNHRANPSFGVPVFPWTGRRNNRRGETDLLVRRWGFLDLLPTAQNLADNRQLYMADLRHAFMASTKKKRPVKKRSEKDEVLECVEMYQLWLARKPMDEICAKYGGISRRTAERRIATGKAIVETAQAIVPPGYKGQIKDPAPSQEEEKKPDPGVVSRGIVVRNGPSNHGALVLPTKNPLAGITDLAEMSKVGIQLGVIAGGAAHDIHEAFTRTDLPLDERMLTLSRGSTVAANTILGIVEMLRVLGSPETSRPMKEVDISGGQR